MFRPIAITAVLNGWIVTCGCQTVVYQDRAQLTSDLDAYLKDPDATEARFLKTGVNQAHTNTSPIGVNETATTSSRDTVRQLGRDAAPVATWDRGERGSAPRG
jgi:hypothetical protein